VIHALLALGAPFVQFAPSVHEPLTAVFQLVSHVAADAAAASPRRPHTAQASTATNCANLKRHPT
jgi:hypothetical protein